VQSHTDGTNIITTNSADAATFYAEGVALLIRSSPDAQSSLRTAVAADGHLSVALAALAVDAQSHGFDYECDQVIARALVAAHGTTRRERQHVEIVALVVRGDLDRAHALRAAHLAEFPNDALIVHLLEPIDPA
jgi:hypothetical protein